MESHLYNLIPTETIENALSWKSCRFCALANRVSDNNMSHSLCSRRVSGSEQEAWREKARFLFYALLFSSVFGWKPPFFGWKPPNFKHCADISVPVIKTVRFLFTSQLVFVCGCVAATSWTVGYKRIRKHTVLWSSHSVKLDSIATWHKHKIMCTCKRIKPKILQMLLIKDLCHERAVRVVGGVVFDQANCDHALNEKRAY